MKRTSKILLCMLLALVMALQLGALAPAASAAPPHPLDPQAKIDTIVVTGPVDDDGNLSESGSEGTVADASWFNSLVGKKLNELKNESFTLAPPDGWAVTSFTIQPSDDAGSYSTLHEKAKLTESDSDGAAIEFKAHDLKDEDFHISAAGQKSFTVHITLSPASLVEKVDATCGKDGCEAYFLVDDAPYLVDLDDLKISATGAHTMTEHPAVAATCTTDGNDAYYECTTCGNLYSNEDGTGKLDAVPTIAALDHVWEYSEPVWSEDNSTCTMTRTCTRAGCTSEPESETVDTTSVTTATCTAGGTRTFTAAFTKTEFGTKTKDVEEDALGHEWGEISYVWNEDNSKCRAIHSCTHDGCDQKDVVIEEVDTSSSVTAAATCSVAEEVTYTADFTVDGLTDQTKKVTGSTDPDKHGPLTKHDAVAPTPGHDGNIEYWTCPCGKFFSDADGEHEIAEADTIDPATSYAIIAAGTDTEWTKGSTTGAKIEIEATYADGCVSAVKVGETELTSSQYEVGSGSVLVTIKPDTLETMESKKYDVVVTFSDGKTATSELTVKDPASTSTELTLKVDEKGLKKTYDGTPFDLEALKDSIKVEGLPDGYKASVSIEYEDSKVTSFYKAGTTTVKLTLTGVEDGDGNDVTSSYTCDPLTGVKLTIEKRKLGVETRSDSIVYNGKAWNASTNCSKSFNPQPIMTYTDPKLTHYVRDGKDYVQTISIRYTASPKSMGTYDNTAEIIIREYEAVKNAKGEWVAKDGATPTVVTENYEVTYKLGKIKITDSSGKVPAGTPVTGDSNNVWIWVGLMAAVVVIVVVLLVVLRKGRKGDEAPSPGAGE